MLRHEGVMARGQWRVSWLSLWPVLDSDLMPLMLVTEELIPDLTETAFVARLYGSMHKHDAGIGKMYEQSGLFRCGGTNEEKKT
jgi:hypothetical protein